MNTTAETQHKAIIIGSACIVFSSLSPEEIKRYQTYHPEALKMHVDNSDKPFFTIALDEEGPGSLTEQGAVFSSATSASGKATITILIDPSCDDRTALVNQKIGGPLLNLIKLENQLVEKLPELEDENNTILNCIAQL